MANLKIGRLMLGMCQTNCYFVYQEGTQEVIFVDPADRGEYIYETLQNNGFTVAGILLTIAASAIQALTVSAQSGLYGFLMHIISTSLLAVTAGIIYRFNHTRIGAAIALTCGTLAMGFGMMLANHFITPVFMGVPVSVVDDMLLTVFLPFNLIKAGFNALITFLVYKPVSNHFIKKN